MKIAYGNSRMEKKWKNRDISWEDFCKKVSSPAVTTETVEEYKKMSKKQQDDIKDVGGFVGGHLKEGRRKSGTVRCRSMLTLDMDYGTAGIVDELEMLFGYQMCIYSTHKHTSEEPRLRLIIPMSREVSEEEYPAIGRMVAKEIGIDMFDDTTYQPQRLMYWPSVSMNGEFVFKELEGNILNPDDYLAMYDDWHDISTHPTSSRQSSAIKKDAKTQADPLEKAGIVGAFCRTYGIRDAIDTFLKDIYEPSAMEGRYDYIPADSSAGVTIHDEKFSYSFHATDPACGMLLNAFDVVRVHLFPDDDEKKSFDAMAEFARNDEQVKLTLFEERQQKAAADFDEEDLDAWKKQLTYQKKTGELENTLHNLVLIMENDEFMKNIVFNQLADGMEIKEAIPWNHPSKFWRDADDAQLICYVDEKYGSFSQRNYSIAVAKVVDDRTYHPIRKFFQSLPKWDGVKRVETLLVDYLGADDSPYVRAITRKLLCAAYVRVHNPGAKFDNMIVLNGGQGIGKSTLIHKLGGEWYSDSLNMDDAESSISKKKKKLSAVKNGIRSIEKVKELVEHMQLLFPKMTCDEQREMYRLFIERIDVFPEEQDSGKMIKSITFKFPIYYEDYETVPTRCPDDQIGFVLDCSALGLTVAEAKATYVEIKAYIKEKFGVKVSSLYIAQIKRKYGLDLGKNYNLSKKENARVPTCPKEKEAYIMDALKYFRMLDMSVEMEA